MSTIDINSIHQKIVNDNSHQKLEELSDEWEMICKELGDNISEDVLTDLKSHIRTNQEKNKYKYYLIASLPILEEFTICRRNMEKISFFKKKSDSVSKDQVSEIIEKYISLVNKYFPGKYTSFWTTVDTEDKKKKHPFQQQIKTICKFCHRGEEDFTIADNHIVCLCGNVIDLTNDNLISYKDIERVNIGSKYSYDRKTHFRECIKRYQGKQNCTIPKEVFSDIIRQLKNYKLIPEKYEKKDEKDIFSNIHREHILMILKDLGYSKYYEDITYIYHKTTNKPIPDITEYENILLMDFDKLLEVYDTSYKDDRKNFINNQYVLYQLLRRHNYPCDKETFTFLKTNDRKSYHDYICGILFHKLNWNFRPLF